MTHAIVGLVGRDSSRTPVNPVACNQAATSNVGGTW